jgi:hypothetical protein
MKPKNKIILRPPVITTPRGLPGLEVRKVFVSIDPNGTTTGIDGPRFTYFIDSSEFNFQGEVSSPAWTHSIHLPGVVLQDALRQILASLEHAADVYCQRLRLGRIAVDETIFPAKVTYWAFNNSEYLALLRFKLEEVDGLIGEAA